MARQRHLPIANLSLQVLGAGKTDGAMDAANLLKPMLARGELRCIGATTLAEYRQHMEKDAAFERRFQQARLTATLLPAYGTTAMGGDALPLAGVPKAHLSCPGLAVQLAQLLA